MPKVLSSASSPKALRSLTDPAVCLALRSQVISLAKAELGCTTNSSRLAKIGEWFGLKRNPWPSPYAAWIYAIAAEAVGCVDPLAGLETKRGPSSAALCFARAKKRGMVLDDKEPLLPGDMIVWQHRVMTGHTGLVTKVNADGSFHTIEGNTSDLDHTSRTGRVVAEHVHVRNDGMHGKTLGVIRPTRPECERR
jgi:CHAP domain